MFTISKEISLSVIKNEFIQEITDTENEIAEVTSRHFKMCTPVNVQGRMYFLLHRYTLYEQSSFVASSLSVPKFLVEPWEKHLFAENIREVDFLSEAYKDTSFLEKSLVSMQKMMLKQIQSQGKFLTIDQINHYIGESKKGVNTQFFEEWDRARFDEGGSRGKNILDTRMVNLFLELGRSLPQPVVIQCSKDALQKIQNSYYFLRCKHAICTFPEIQEESKVLDLKQFFALCCLGDEDDFDLILEEMDELQENFRDFARLCDEVEFQEIS